MLMQNFQISELLSVDDCCCNGKEDTVLKNMATYGRSGTELEHFKNIKASGCNLRTGFIAQREYLY